MKELKIEITNTDVRHIDFESLKRLAANPNVSAEIRGTGDVFICYSESAEPV